MLFSSLIFLYVFLPFTLLIGWFSGRRLQNYALLLLSLIFYAWGGVSYTAIVLFSILFNYLFGLWIGKYPQTSKGKAILTACIAGNLLLLCVIKYLTFFIANINEILISNGNAPFKIPDINLIPGISFFTFHSISYIVDIYRNESAPQKNFFSMGLYIVFFPQLIAGPIIRYHEIADQFNKRETTINNIFEGIQRFLTGLVKKVIFSNTFAFPADEIFKTNLSHIDTPVAWFGIICYTLHIYCDFSGYSDMAIGLGKMFGFTFPENFNFPYLAKSIQDFWHRWHITLSRWFRDYLYIPLGGNQKGTFRTYLNLIIVFFLTGFWHGASWNMVIWGLFHGFFLILERSILKKTLEKLFFLNRLYTLLVVMIAWVFFKSSGADYAITFIQRMFGSNQGIGESLLSVNAYRNIEFDSLFIIALLFVFGIPHFIKNKLTIYPFGKSLINLLNPVRYAFSLILLLLCTVYLIKQGYNPFIYFQF